MNLDRPKKPKMLVVDDEPDNLDLLYRTFRRDFNVFKADSGIAALEVLATAGEVAVIISDQRMPEMKGTEFLSKTVPQFPDTMRIILTGFTDVEDLVDAINSGQVYKYITKPWDPNELKSVVQRAAETYELLKQRTEELLQAQAHTALFNSILQTVRQGATVEACLAPIATTLGTSFGTDGCILQLVEGTSLTAHGGHSTNGELKNWLELEPLTQAAIATQQFQSAISDTPGIVNPLYAEAGLSSHLIVPTTFHNKVLAVLSLQWKSPRSLSEPELTMLHQAAQQIGMALNSVRCP
ncbi:MAG: response regulator [Timaviella obliquedivisa GSE-PSE-MK23-08B]|jgi:CheY-like chemotaxis protein|nr:response regulator [Timaviella obliquedivisa GSE-PSE-MK23-08B]